MTGVIPDDSTLARLRALPHVTPDRESAARIRVRSHAALALLAQRDRVRGRLASRLVDVALVLVSVVYLSGAAAQAWRLLIGIG